MSKERYGKKYWAVQLKDGGQIQLHADYIYVNKNGDILFLKDTGDTFSQMNLALPAGSWYYAYAANVLDGSPVAVEHWE